jgi:hypothetical protein
VWRQYYWGPPLPGQLSEPAARGSKSESPIASYRDTLSQLGQKLERLKRLWAERDARQAETDSLKGKREELLHAIVMGDPAERRERSQLEDAILKLDLKREIAKAELDYGSGQIHSTEDELQAWLLHATDSLEQIWRSLAEWTRDKEYRAVEACVHPEFRGTQRLLIEQFVLISTGVIAVGKLKPELHSIAAQPLYDSPAIKWSVSREQTVRMMTQETERLLSSSERLFQALEESARLGLSIPECPPFVPRARASTEWPEPPPLDEDSLPYDKTVGTTTDPATYVPAPLDPNTINFPPIPTL